MTKAATASENFSFFLPITKIDKERRLISGYASTPALDLDGEIVALDAVRKALPGYWQWRNIRRMHTADAVGVAKEANVDDKGLFLTSKIIDDDCWKKILEGVYKGYSIGGKKLAKTGNTITEIEMVEVSVVDRPANPECRFDVHKGAAPGAAALFVKLPKEGKDPRDRALGQMAKAVQSLAKAPPAGRDGFSLPAPAKAVKKNGGDEPCEAHGVKGCKECLDKRDVSGKERKDLASEGKALPDGSFPIANKDDLANARQAIGRAKNPSKARAHISRRARALGVKLPETWSKKLAKTLIAHALVEKINLGSADPSFLTLEAEDEGVGTLVKGARSGHEPLPASALTTTALGKDGIAFSKRERKMLKRMGVAGQLAYCFDSVRSAQRSLLMEARQEGGDMKDKGLAEKLGALAKELAAVIGQKAEHEGAEALDLSDADDQGFLELGGFAMSAQKGFDMKNVLEGNSDPIVAAVAELMKRASTPTRAARMVMARGDLKKARKAASDMEDCIKSAHSLLKARYLAKQALIKAGKKPADDDGDDMDAMGKVMAALNKAYGASTTLKTFIKSANVQLKKAQSRSGQRGQEAGDGNENYSVPPGVKSLTPSDVDTAGGSSEPFVHGMEHPFPGKGAKPAMRKGMVSASEAEALARAAAAEAQVEILSKLPAAPSFGKRPALTDLSKIVGGTRDEATAIMKGVDPADLTRDEKSNQDAISKMIGNMIVGGHGRSVMDDSFRGTGGLV